MSTMTSTNGQKYAAIYARVSTEEQGLYGYSLPTQLADCQALARREGLPMLEPYCFSEDYSGMTLNRPQLTKLRELVRTQPVQAVIVRDLDRLSRKLAHQIFLREELAQAGVELRVVSLPDLTSAPESQLMANVWGSFAEYERLKILERTKRGLLGRAAAGKVSGSRVPLGYRYVDGVFSIDEEEAALVRYIFQLYIDDSWSLYTIAKHLTEAGIPTHRDRRQTGPVRRLKPGTWHPAVLHIILTNETYIGTYYWNKTESITGKANPDKKTRVRRRPREEWVAIPVPPIVDPETFARAQAALTQHAALSTRNSKRQYLLGQSRLRCLSCRCAMGGTAHRKSGVRSYRCNRLPSQLTATCRRVKAVDVEAWAWERLSAAIQDPALFAKAVEDLRTEARKEAHALHAERTCYTQEVAKRQKQIAKAYAAYEADVDSLAEYKAKKATYEAEMKGFETEIAQIDALLQDLDVEELDLRGVEEFRAHVQGDLAQFTFAERQRTLDAFRVTVYVQADGTYQLHGVLPQAPETGQIVSIRPRCRSTPAPWAQPQC